ncbi:hypothetical protein [Aestuariibaculum sediminum]|uniref:Uncharacterized protein n=1 Tax=Aestuariibaculum sediminum TaxID=2770637 RepID=A0A8J6U755_9FLAO|nr:hypothetical protein [Aestuariibaculum sediminum]MBD0831405.1 hypothetical protein [Aestuariibaculum sediminum]
MKTVMILLIALIFFSSCESDDPPATLDVNSFQISGNTYNTGHGYLLLDDGPNFTNGFGLGFLNGIMIDDNINGASIETTTTHGVALWVDLSTTPSISEQDVTNQIISNTTYNLNEETTAIINITNYTNTHTYNGSTYGEPDEPGATTYETGATGNGTVTINSFSVNLTSRTGTIDCTYAFMDNNGVNITGNYMGSFDIINEF